MEETKRPLLIFDGDCGFCRRWVGRWRRITGDAVAYAPYQEVSSRFPEIPPEDFQTAVQFLDPSGSRSQGAEAVFRSLSYTPRCRWMLALYSCFPPFRLFTEAVYRMVASHRDAAARMTQFLWGDVLDRPEYDIACRLFLRALGLIYLVAFCSLWTQISGLIGRNGILPLGPFLEAVRNVTGSERYWLLPTLSWFDGRDAFTHLLCGSGVMASVLLIVGITPAPCALLLWILYLSLATDCREFLGFQWDALLLEAGFLAIFLAPLRLRLSTARHEYSRLFHFLLRWLLFRLMFSSGFVKLASGDATWRSLGALKYHFETQPLPTWVGWYAHQLPDHLKTAMTAVMFFIELVVPFFIFTPRRLRLLAFVLLTFLQIAIALTGNYAFFNLLTIALCLLLLDNSLWPRGLKIRSVSPGRAGGISLRRWPNGIRVAAGIVILLLTTVAFANSMRVDIAWPHWLTEPCRRAAPFRCFNGYGLFAIMTTSRPEISVEGSEDGWKWRPYIFKWKPGDLRHPPDFVAPHQPRLDWQMWFAALGTYESNPWLENFLARLLLGSPEVLSLLDQNPFPAHPPKYIRAMLYDYRFTTTRQKSESGEWWRREPAGVYFPVRKLPDKDAH